jgi:hypothetical protein
VGGTLSITGQANFAGGTTYKWDTSGDVYGRQLFSGTAGVEGVKISQDSGIGIIAALGAGGLSFRDDANTQLMNLADSTGVVSIPSTTASTTTSSGALVVGNGTSGGLGVGGAINAGGILKTTVADAAYNARFFGATGGMRVRGYTDATYGTVVDSLNTAESAYQPLTIAASDLRLNDLTNGTIVTGTGTFTIGGAVVANASSNAFRITNSQTPASAGATGTAGTICWDTSYIYVCTATNTWKRVAIATW